MKPCIIIKGDFENIEDFENRIALAMDQGYEISGELISHVINYEDRDLIILLQPMFLSDESYNESDNF